MTTNGTPEQKPITVLALHSEHVKRLRAVSITPAATGLVKIAGLNANGKSSVLDSIMLVLGGKGAEPAVPINRDHKHAKAELDLGEFRVTKTITETDSYLTVTRRGADGKPAKVAKPQEFLDSLVGSGIGFDPIAFSRLAPKQQAEVLLGLLQLPEDPRVIAAEKKRIYVERTALNKEVRALEAKVASLPDYPPELAAAEEQSVAALTREHQQRLETKRAQDALRNEVTATERQLQEAKERVARLYEEVVKAEASVKVLAELREMVVRKVGTLVAPDLEDIPKRIDQVEAVNAKIRSAKHRGAAEDEHRAAEARAKNLTDRIQALEDRKRALLAAATFPVEGLGFEEIDEEHHVTYRGIPLRDCAASEQIRIGMAMALAVNPTVRVILLRDGSLLDAPTREYVSRFALDNGVQVWLELVGEGDGDSFVIEDGAVVRTPGGTPPAPAEAFSW